MSVVRYHILSEGRACQVTFLEVNDRFLQRARKHRLAGCRVNVADICRRAARFDPLCPLVQTLQLPSKPDMGFRRPRESDTRSEDLARRPQP